MLADLHDKRPRRRPGGTCTIVRIIARLEEDDRAWLLAALDDPDEKSSDIAWTLTNAGHQISPVSLARHRRKDCTCESR